MGHSNRPGSLPDDPCADTQECETKKWGKDPETIGHQEVQLTDERHCDKKFQAKIKDKMGDRLDHITDTDTMVGWAGCERERVSTHKITGTTLGDGFISLLFDPITQMRLILWHDEGKLPQNVGLGKTLH